MHHDVAAVVAALLSGVKVGRSWGHDSGLTVVPLEEAGGHPRGLVGHAAGPPEVGEMAPPRAGELLVANRRPGAITLHQGDLFIGGLSDRADQAAMVVGPGEERILPVEPTEPRWWWTGPPVLDGALDPPLSALVALAALEGMAPGGLSAIARTGLWAVASRSAAGESAVPDHGPVTISRGWVLLAGAAVLATRVWDRPRSLASGPPEPAVPLSAAAAVAARVFLESLARGPWGEGVAEAGVGVVPGHHAGVTIHAGRVVELGSVRLSDELADILLRGPSRGRTPVR